MHEKKVSLKKKRGRKRTTIDRPFIVTDRITANRIRTILKILNQFVELVLITRRIRFVELCHQTVTLLLLVRIESEIGVNYSG